MLGIGPHSSCYSIVRILFEWHGVQKDCPSGELSRRKFLSIYSTLFPEGKAGPFYEHVFRTFDEDGSGRIDFKEFLQARDSFYCTQFEFCLPPNEVADNAGMF